MESRLTSEEVAVLVEGAALRGDGGVERCVALGNDPDLIRGQAGFHWWPDRVTAN